VGGYLGGTDVGEKLKRDDGFGTRRGWPCWERRKVEPVERCLCPFLRGGSVGRGLSLVSKKERCPTVMSARRRIRPIGIVDPKEAVDLATAQSYPENVVLFVPNLILGRSLHSCPSPVSRHQVTRGSSSPLLHELPPALLHGRLWCIVSPRRHRRECSPCTHADPPSSVPAWT
jgi:hypothetical protein